MQICRNKQQMRECVSDWRMQGSRIALVPTMGALHDGHITLLARARDWVNANGGGRVITSIFVNPTQFGPNEDLDKYPRNEEQDLALLKQAGCDAVFLPSVEDIYRPGSQTFVDVTDLSHILMGRLRPGHFRGVATVVTKLFNITDCDAATFGEKDYQQLTIVRQMVADLEVPVEIIPVPTVREADGLAMSSRNLRLTPEDRAAAVVLSHALDQAQEMIEAGATLTTARRELRRILKSEPRGDIRSIDIRDAKTLARITTAARPVVMLLAVRFGDVLLIDQRVASP